MNWLNGCGTFVIAERAPAQPWTRSPESITMGAIPMRRTTLLVLLTLALLPLWLLSQDKKATVISVDAARPGATISPSMFGIFFEDINFAADGGLYPELVKNRSFEFQQPLSGWHEVLGYSEKGTRPSRKANLRFTPRTRSIRPILTILRSACTIPAMRSGTLAFAVSVSKAERNTASLPMFAAPARSLSTPGLPMSKDTKSEAESSRDLTNIGNNTRPSSAPMSPCIAPS